MNESMDSVAHEHLSPNLCYCSIVVPVGLRTHLPHPKRQRFLARSPLDMSTSKVFPSESSEALNVHPVLSPETKKDLEDALDETMSAEDAQKKAWVEDNRRDLFNAFAIGRKLDPFPHKDIEVFSAVEGTDADLRRVLNNIYEKYGPLTMFDKGVDGLARHWVVGYQSMRGTQTVQKVMLYVEGTEWTRSSRVLDSLTAMIQAEDAGFPDDEDWAVVEKPVGGLGFKRCKS